MPNSRANKEERSMMGRIYDYVTETVNKPRKAEDLVEEDSIGGRLKKAKDKRKEAIDRALSE